jgi:hypothetical protein
MSMGVQGTYFNIERFLGKIENLKRAVLVTSVTLNVGTSTSASTSSSAPAAGVGVSPTLSGTLAMRTFMVSSAVAPAGSPLHVAAPTAGAAGAPATASTTPAQ